MLASGKPLAMISMNGSLATTALPATASIQATAEGASASLVRDIGFCLLVSAVLCVVFTRLKIPSIAAFLVAGLILGPELGGVVTDRGNIETIAELGLIFLLFVIGLELDFKKLSALGKTLIISGVLQFPLCVAFGYVVALLLRSSGWDIFSDTQVCLYAGLAIAASSTLLVVKLLQERFQMDTVAGRIAVGILVAQDIWAMVVLACQPNFQNPEVDKLGLTFLGIGLVIAVSLPVAKYVLPIVFRWIAKVPDLMLVVAIGWCFAVGTFGYHLEDIFEVIGIHVSIDVPLEMSALIAGATIAALPYAHEVVTRVGVVRDFFATLFFVGLGMRIPIPDSAQVILIALVLAFVVILSRYVVLFPILYFTGLDRRNAMVSTTRLAQISEFSLVIAYLGLGFGHITSDLVTAIIFAFVITALITPSLFGMGDSIHDRLGNLLTRLGFKAPPVGDRYDEEEEEPAIVLLGFHSVASSLIHELKRARPDLLKKTLVIDFNVRIHPAIRQAGARVKYGDISNQSVLQSLGIDQARVIICTVADSVLKGVTNRDLTRTLRRLNPDARIIMNADRTSMVKEIYDAGADYVYLARVEAALGLLPVLDAAIDGSLEAYRAELELRFGPADTRNEVLP